MTNEFQPATDDELESEDFALDDGTEEQPEVELEEQPDPLADIIARLEKLEPLSKLNPAQVNSELGRVRTLQSKIDALGTTPSAPDMSPRLEQLEAYLETLAEAIISSDFAADDSKQRIATIRENAKNERIKTDLLRDLQKNQAPAKPQETTELEPEELLWAAASQDVVAEAQALGFDPSTIPVEVWQEGRGLGSIYKATNHVVAWMKEQQQKEDAPPARVAQRKTAAGKGSPERSGGAGLSDEDLWDDYGANPAKYTTTEDVAKVMSAGKRLGYIS